MNRACKVCGAGNVHQGVMCGNCGNLLPSSPEGSVGFTSAPRFAGASAGIIGSDLPVDPIAQLRGELATMRRELSVESARRRALEARLNRRRVFDLVDKERDAQEAKHGGRTIADRLPILEKLAIISEEAGEVAKAGLDMKNAFGADCLAEIADGSEDVNDSESLRVLRVNLEKELVQLASCAIAWLEAEDL